jgi:hypothetical protein
MMSCEFLIGKDAEEYMVAYFKITSRHYPE